MSGDTLHCKKCDKEFNRKLHYTQHMSRITPCYKELSCNRCGKDFNLLGDLK